MDPMGNKRCVFWKGAWFNQFEMNHFGDFFWQKPSPKTSSESPWKSLQLEYEAFPFGTYNEGKYLSQLGGSLQLGSGSSVVSNWTRDASLPMIWWCQTVKHIAEVLSIDLGLWPIVCPAASSSSPVQRRAARAQPQGKETIGRRKQARRTDQAESQVKNQTASKACLRLQTRTFFARHALCQQSATSSA